MAHKKRGWNARELAAAGRKTEDDEDDSILPELVSEEDFMNWREQGKQIVRGEADRQWALGQWIVDGEEMKEIAGITVDQRFKNSVYKAAADITGYSVKTVKALANVVRHVPKEIKEEFKVSFAHLKLVASPSLNVEQQRQLLAEMERSNLNVNESRAKVDFFKGVRTEGKSRVDRQAARIAWHCAKLMKALEEHDLSAASPKAYNQCVDTLVKTWHKVGDALADLDAAPSQQPALVSNQR
jgi:hypothetical protein